MAMTLEQQLRASLLYFEARRPKRLERKGTMPTEYVDGPLPPHYRGCYDHDYVEAWELGEKDVTVTIARLQVGKLTSQEKKKADRKLILFFEGKEKGFVCNITNAKTIAGMYGNKPADWVGKSITIYATETQVGRDIKPCIRIRPKVPLQRVKSEAG